MPGPLKKARAVYPLEEYVPDEEEQEMQDDLVGQIIPVDFDAFKAEDGDFHGIKRLLLQSFRGLDIDTSGLADIIISQNYIGSVVKQVNEDDDDDDDEEEEMVDEDIIFGVSTIINLTSRKDEEPVAKIRTALVERCQELGNDSTNQLVRESLGNESKHVGLLISERLVNLPPQFAIPVYESLIKELEAAKKKGLAYDFTYFVMVCKIYKMEGKKNKKNNPTADQLMWSNPEEEVFFEESIASFEYSVKGLTGDFKNEEDAQYSPWRRVLIFNANQLPAILIKVKEAVA